MKTIIKSIASGKTKNYALGKNNFLSAYKKDDFFETIKVNALGFINDEQADKRFHGGVDKAIHIGSYTHINKNPEFDKLFIGCNILVDTFDEDAVCIGDIYSIGEVLVEVTQPRQPCWKIGALFGKEVSRYISKNHATGWYVRIIREGSINKKDKMILEKRVSVITIKELSIYLKVPPSDKKLIDEILNLEVIAQSYKSDFLSSLNKKKSQ